MATRVEVRQLNGLHGARGPKANDWDEASCLTSIHPHLGEGLGETINGRRALATDEAVME